MATKVFISWSGELSNKLAEALREWLPAVLQFVKPYFTPDDIEKGAKWNSDITKELEESNIGIICLTKDNTEKPWILFEAGALSKSFDQSNVCTIFFNLDTTDVKGPLTSFQGTKFQKNDFKKLISTINKSSTDNSLDSNILDDVFEMWWPRLEEKVKKIINDHNEPKDKIIRSERDILEELLEITRMNSSRNQRNNKINENVLYDLLEIIEELKYISINEDNEIFKNAINRLSKPFKFLCMESGMPELYEKLIRIDDKYRTPVRRRRVLKEQKDT